MNLPDETDLRNEQSVNPGVHVEPSGKKRLKDFFGICGLALGPTALANYFGTIFLHRLPTQYLALLDIVIFLVCFLLLVRVHWKPLLPHLLQVLYLTITICLLLPLMRNMNWWTVSDDVKLSRALIDSLKTECPPDKGAGDTCVIQRLGTLSIHGAPKLVDDLRIGETLTSNPRVKSVLDRCYGVKDEFTGTGLSLPDSAKGEYEKCRIPEYWIPNMTDTSEEVWTWIIDPESTQMKLPLLDILMVVDPTVKHRDPEDPNRFLNFSQELDRNTDHLALSDPLPILVRFGQFPASNYSNRLGQAGAKLVFTNHFGELIRLNLTLSEAASYSGRSIKTTDSPEKVFIWIIFPTNSRQVIPATWRGLLGYMANHSLNQPACTP